MKERVEKLINEEVAPYLESHGGGIELVDVSDDGVVKVRLQGACAGCPGARATLKGVVLKALQEKIPEVCDVVAEFV